MKQVFFLVFCLLFLAACQAKKEDSSNNQAQNQTLNQTETSQTEANEASAQSKQMPEKEQVSGKPRGSIYRCDGFYNGIASEWIQVAFSQDGSKIEGIWYWNTQDENKKALQVSDYQVSKGEISGSTGIVTFPTGEKYGFGQVEDRFNLTHEDGRFQEFEYESNQ
ncbi:hypothetical protein [Hugenholtzia roseola]|uniref:hypothetical protein n=1 Tax=Hugenholtzia roseola TaxID=1002 RepID=UPI0004017EA3|nr:hypothetical protein [Hugenholtzia roseola]